MRRGRLECGSKGWSMFTWTQKYTIVLSLTTSNITDILSSQSLCTISKFLLPNLLRPPMGDDCRYWRVSTVFFSPCELDVMIMYLLPLRALEIAGWTNASSPAAPPHIGSVFVTRISTPKSRLLWVSTVRIPLSAKIHPRPWTEILSVPGDLEIIIAKFYEESPQPALIARFVEGLKFIGKMSEFDLCHQ